MVAIDHVPTVLEEILRFNADRKPSRVRLKLKRMAESPFAFFRGADHLYARAWPELQPPEVGPSILVCGDLHLENFGAYRTDESDFYYDINDFDEALVAPCSLDLIRCTTSILLASELWKLTPLQAMGMALVFLENYGLALARPAHVPIVGTEAPRAARGAIWDLLGATALGSQVALLDQQTRIGKGGERQIIRDEEKHPPITKKRMVLIAKSVEEYGSKTPAPDSYQVIDVTGRIAGIGSLGLKRYAVLIKGEVSPDQNRMLDIKECRPSALRSCTSAPQLDCGEDEATRVVEAQRRLQAKPVAGLDVIPIGQTRYRIRELIPEENRSSLDRLRKRPDKLREAIEFAGRLTGWSHLRGCKLDGGLDETAALVRWATSPALDAVLAAAARYAERTRIESEQFVRALASSSTASKKPSAKPSKDSKAP
jgi:uncharacterized protein (DUF2252 family)